jgi:hypothetical protein
VTGAAEGAKSTTSPAADVRQCRNCGAPAPGRFCAECGQETDLRLPTLREFLREAAGRYVAFDGRFWRTIATLVFRPGRLTREYLAGRRRRYIRPARLYLFSTLVFFAVSRFFVAPLNAVEGGPDAAPGAAGKAPAAKLERPETPRSDESGLYIDDEMQLHVPDAMPGGAALKKRWQRFSTLTQEDKAYQLTDGMLRYGPYAMFALLPALAFVLQLAYLGRHRRYPQRPRLYGEHMVFAAHNQALVFAAGTALLLSPIGLLRAVILGWIVVYLFRSLHRVYGGSWLGVALRGSFLFLIYSVLLGLATAGLAIVAVLLR